MGSQRRTFQISLRGHLPALAKLFIPEGLHLQDQLTRPRKESKVREKVPFLSVMGTWTQHNKERRARNAELITTRVLGVETANFRKLRNLISLVH